MIQPRLSVVIVNYNVRHFLEQALYSVRRAAALEPVEVWVVDNNSVDDSVKMVREKFPEVHLICNTENTGFSVANNQAILQSTGAYVLLLNPDTVVEEDTFLKVVNFMDEHPDAGGLGVKMIDGAGKFLPESKRGFPNPFVAFCKTFGLSTAFPKSKLFNRYHLGYLSEDEVHQVDVLSGAFMLMRRSVLDETGLLDETFFMYGEDIDLSYRIIMAGYKNYYYPGTTIIHYKGESTKKGSLNYVRTFYQAMIIFARKHFKGEKAFIFILMLQAAIYFRGGITLLSGIVRRFYRPVLDAAIIFAGLILLKNFWAESQYKDPDYYPLTLLTVNFPMYIGIWLGAIFLSGGYDERQTGYPMVRGLVAGTIFLAAVYGFLPADLRTSRFLILAGAVWAGLSMTILRLALHFIKHRNFKIDTSRTTNLVIVGTAAESNRVMQLVHKAGVQVNFIGTVAPEGQDGSEFIGSLRQLDEIVHIYKVTEIIFCSSDVSSGSIMSWMTHIGPDVSYKIVPENSHSIIGSNSKNTLGELYTVEIKYNILTPSNCRNKRLLDLAVAFFFLLLSPVFVLFLRQRKNFLRNILAVFTGRRTWVGYTPTETASTLPSIRPGILSPIDALQVSTLSPETISRLNFFYAKDYTPESDLEIIWNAWRLVGR